MCGIHFTVEEREKRKIKEDSLYKAYLKSKSLRKTTNVNTVPNWRSFMEPVENQGTCGSCWAYGPTGAVEGAIQYYVGSNIGLDLDENDVFTNSGGGNCNGGDVGAALSYIENSRVPTKAGLTSYPNLAGVKYSITGYPDVSGIDNIKAALAYSPVVATFDVYQDFQNVFAPSKNNVYKWDKVSAYVAGHAVVIIGYDDNKECWICKNSWGTGWGYWGGYFNIGYGECNIEVSCNTISVNQSCLAKIVPNMISSLNTAMSYPFAAAESAYVLGNASLTANISVPSGVTLNINSGAALTLGSSNLFIDGGNLNNSGSFTGLKDYLKTGNNIMGYCSTIQAAVNHSTSSQTVELLNQTFNENISVSNKTSQNYLTITGQGINNSIINGSVYLYNSGNIEIENLKIVGNKITSNTMARPTISNVQFVMPYGNTVFSATNTSAVTIDNIIVNNDPGSGEDPCLNISAASGDVTNSNITGQLVGVSLTGNSSFNVQSNSFCNNEEDVYAASPAFAYCRDNTYSSLSSLHYFGNVMFLGDSTFCGSTKAAKPLNKVKRDGGSTVRSKELEEVENLYLGVLKNIRDNSNGAINLDNYYASFLPVINKAQSAIENNPESEENKVFWDRISSCYLLCGKEELQQAYFGSIMNNVKYSKLKYNAEKYLIDYYVHIKDYPNALSTADNILTNCSSDKDLYSNILFTKGLLYANNLSNTEKAITAFSEIISNYPESSIKPFAKNELERICSNCSANGSNTDIKAGETIESGNYPNPFNPSTTIKYTLPQLSNVTVVIYDILGRVVKSFNVNTQVVGKQSLVWNGTNDFNQSVASGIYICRIKAVSLEQSGKIFEKSSKLLLMK
jgi:tetratricopeptide (TPR) repeat protein